MHGLVAVLVSPLVHPIEQVVCTMREGSFADNTDALGLMAAFVGGGDALNSDMPGTQAGASWRSAEKRVADQAAYGVSS